MLFRQIVILLLLAVQSIFGLFCSMEIKPTCQEMNCEKGTKCVITSECGDKKCEVIEKPQDPLTPLKPVASGVPKKLLLIRGSEIVIVILLQI